MVEEQAKQQNYPPPLSNSDAVIEHFRAAIVSGTHWYPALLESMSLWTEEQETINGEILHYVIEGEAFDWLLLAQRLCDTANSLIPEEEKYALLFKAKAPIPISTEEFKYLMGTAKYHKYLNFFYGVTVEEALIQSVLEEVRKEHYANARPHHGGEEQEAFAKIYDVPLSDLLKQFRKEKHYHQAAASNLTQMKEFTYWCFKYRVRISEKARVASDTNKGLEWLRRNGYNC
jgi:hypothetical protein